MMKLKSLDMKYSKSVLFRLLELKEAFQKDLSPIVKNWAMLKQVLNALEKDGLIKITASTKGKKQYRINLTERGKAVAEKLKEAENVAKMTPEELEERRKNIHWIVDINTYVDHITAYDIHNGKKEIFNIWLKPNGKYLLLYCDKCNSYDCYHIDWALHDPVIGPELKEKAEKKGLKIKNLEAEKKEE